MLKTPQVAFPHYAPLMIDGKVVYICTDEGPLSNELFLENKYFLDKYNLKVEVSNYGRVEINNAIKTPDVEDNILKQGLTIYINEDWPKEPIHRLVMETFDPIVDMEQFQVYHVNANKNDNRMENLIWVDANDHGRIEAEFTEWVREFCKVLRGETKVFPTTGNHEIDFEKYVVPWLKKTSGIKIF